MDLCEKQIEKREVIEETARSYALKNDMIFNETSALMDHNISESFNELLEGITNKK